MKIQTGRIVQAFIILIVAGLALVLAAGVWRGKSQRNRQNIPEAKTTDAEMKLTDMEFIEMEHGKRFWKLSASEAEYFQDQQKTLLRTVHLTFYLEKAGEEIRIESQEGILYAGTKNIELRGSVRAVLPRDYIILMEKAIYDHQERTVGSEDRVRISGPGLELEGGRWEYSIPGHVAAVDGGVKVSMVGAELKID
ncbi:MAG: LPS export ABC transporter periplasmic protein LptC [Syntrophobacteraceae bacterium]